MERLRLPLKCTSKRPAQVRPIQNSEKERISPDRERSRIKRPQPCISAEQQLNTLSSRCSWDQPNPVIVVDRSNDCRKTSCCRKKVSSAAKGSQKVMAEKCLVRSPTAPYVLKILIGCLRVTTHLKS